MKVLVSDRISQAGIDTLEEKGVDVTYNTELSYQELLDQIGDYDGIILRSMTPLNEEVLEQATKLKVIARAGSGYDNIDVDAASKQGIIVLNTPGQNTISAAEQTMALMLAVARNVPQAHNALQDLVWDRNKYMGVELNNKTLGIIGLGRVGGNVAKRAKSFNMEVIANDPYIPAKRGRKLGVELVDLEEILERSDFISLHTPLTEETEHILSTEEFSKMKDGVRVINVARGKNVDHVALYKAIKAGKVVGAALDVHEEEPINEDYSLLDLEEVILAPHLGGTTVEAMDNVSIDAARQLLNVLLDEQLPRTPLNVPIIKPAEMNLIKPYIKLGEKLGGFYSGWIGGRIEQVEVIYQGDIAKQDVEPVTTSLLKGLLKPILDENINLVNASLVARERGIEIIETKSETSDKYSSLITVKIKNNGSTKTISGTVFDEQDIRIVNIDNYGIDLIPEGSLLITDHQDQPGIVGELGTLLGENGINIASMQLGRNRAGGDAVMVLNIDQEGEEKLQEKILEIDGMLDVSIFTL
ncbi:phosphoglycerate dehydrogenase [Natroniella sulfidigena]|uniref:phosphoglycerate dehydrogenase n=1 Tax=Natroniella sulfidigena TaxID=723921 RepID=UPI00200B0697|nr:phosphoglycerate dehydrogenase [Natroniella sulfidigena]MCK8817106.1 phosphoglycerate dehydrogenase [Natroniella sulfidigena]